MEAEDPPYDMILVNCSGLAEESRAKRIKKTF